jgi:lysyl-tRNA synthetase class I
MYAPTMPPSAFRGTARRLRAASMEWINCTHPFDIAKENGMDPPVFFSAFYKAVLYRNAAAFGSFVQLVGLSTMISMLEKTLSR